MRPALSRGQPPAKGVLHVEQRTPHNPQLKTIDPRGDWLGQHSATPERKARRALIARLGRQFLKQIKERRRAAL